MLWVREALGIRSIDDLRAMKKPLQIGSTGRTPTGDEGSRVIAQVLGLNIKIIRGYDSSPAIILAMEREEVDATMIGISSLSTTKPEWLKPDSPVNPVLQFGLAVRAGTP